MKRAAEKPAADYRADRNKWSSLVELAHAAAASDVPADLKTLSERALASETCWQMLAPFPRGLVCRILSRTAWAFGRQPDAALRAQLSPLLIASAGLVDELFQQTASDPSAEAAPAAPVVGAAPVAQRLPYADA